MSYAFGGGNSFFAVDEELAEDFFDIEMHIADSDALLLARFFCPADHCQLLLLLLLMIMIMMVMFRYITFIVC